MARSVRPWQDRLWEKVDKAGPAGCWVWRASRNAAGYGQMSMPGGGPKLVHRLVCELYHGPSALDCLHSCDNPACCNPEHLSWGTHSENMQQARDRKRVGPHQRLTAEQAAEIRSSTARVKDLCEMYGISRWQVTNIRSGRQWTQ